MPAPPHDASGHIRRHPAEPRCAKARDGPARPVAGHDSDMPRFEGIPSDDGIIAGPARYESPWPALGIAQHGRVNARRAD